MTADRLLTVLSEMRPLPADFVIALRRELTYISLPESHFLLESPAVSQSAFFLEKGFAIGYSYYRKRRSVTALWSDGEIILAPMSFYAQVPALQFIQLMEDSELICISHDGVHRLRAEFSVARDLCQLIAGRYVERYRQQVLELQNDSTRERYENLLARYPGIERRISQDVISSYLGISGPALSRLKSKLR